MEKLKPITVTNGFGDKVRIHKIKTIQPHFNNIRKGSKTFEIRYFDRDYQVGDYLLLVEYPQVEEVENIIVREITHMLTHEEYEGIKKDYVILSVKSVSQEEIMRINRILSIIETNKD